MLEKILNNIFYTRETYGLNGDIISIKKLKTMEDSTLSYVEKVNAYETDELGKLIEDPGMRSYGVFLRKYWIDELPQLYSVLVNDMALVGVRPKEKCTWDTHPKSHTDRIFKFKPGLIGINYLIRDRLKHLSKNQIRRKNMALERLYCMEKSKAPFKTDFKYAKRVIGNIIFKKMRSS